MRATSLIIFLPAFLFACDSANEPDVPELLPTTGTAVAELAAFDDAMREFMLARGKRGATLAVIKDGVMVLERGYGWKDEAEKTPMPPDALMRLASVTKPITAAAVRQLMQDGLLNGGDRVFCVAGSGTPCWFNLEPPGNPDPRLHLVTIQHLLDHRGGWKRSRYDNMPLFSSHRVADTLGVPSPPADQDCVRFMMGQPLDYAPGSTYSYSNFGYALLGFIIEKASGRSFLAYVRDEILNPIGVPDSEVDLGRSLPEHRNPREPWYSSAWEDRSAFPPYDAVRAPDGVFHLEAGRSGGGLIASARTVALFIHSYYYDGTPLTGPPPETNSFDGGLPGTITLAHWRPDGVGIVALFNKQTEGELAPSDFLLADILGGAATNISTWPTE